MSKQTKCVCGKRIMFVEGDWHHVWWKKDRETGRFVMHGCQACSWGGRPTPGVLLAMPAETSAQNGVCAPERGRLV